MLEQLISCKNATHLHNQNKLSQEVESTKILNLVKLDILIF